jgi:integrase
VLDAWLTRCRPVICNGATPYLFPNSIGAKRSREAVASKVTVFLAKETGLEMHLHLFRHLAAKLYLDVNPNGIELVSQLLGHTSTRTTLKAYAELNIDPAFKNLERSIFGIVDRSPPATDSRRRSA